LQLRHHPELLKWKEKIDRNKLYSVEMKILVRRDDWYFESWKAKEKESGGLLFNIGVHYFDALTFLFGEVKKSECNGVFQKFAHGTLHFERVLVDWTISLEAPMDNQKRMLKIDGEALNLSQGFENLHTKVYEELLNGRGVPISACADTVKLIETIKQT